MSQKSFIMLPQRCIKKLKSDYAPTKVTGNFYECLRVVFVVYRLIGLLPLSNVVHSKPGQRTRFSWKSPYTLLIYIPSLLLQGFLTIVQLCKKGDGMLHINSFLFYIFIIVQSSLILRICLKWTKLLADIENIEKMLPPIKRPRSFMIFIKRFVAISICLGMGEIFVFVSLEIDKTSKCYLQSDDSGLYLKSYYMFANACLYEIFPFSYTFSFVIQIVKFQAMFTWYFCDILMMTICIYLNNQFKNFNRLIIQDEFSFQQFFRPSWSILQVHFTRISQLVAIVDDKFNALFFMSYSYNLYHICLHLYLILNKLTENQTLVLNNCLAEQNKEWIFYVFRMYIMTFLALKVVLISHLAAELHVSSRKPLGLLHTVPSGDYDNDMQRLMNQVYHSKVSISGLRFFQITRGVLLGIFAKIMTYELVLIQFDTPDENKEEIYREIISN